MKITLLIAGALALGFASQAPAKPGHGHGNPHAYGYAERGCPPGLAKKAIPCVPPGQAKKMYGIGDRLPYGAFRPYSYDRIPYRLRERYRLSPYGRYYYGDGYLYRVDPRTMLIRQVVAALLYR